MVRLIFILFSILAMSISGIAGAEDLAVPSALCRCDPEVADGLEGPGQLNFGAFSGQCVDTCRFRQSVQIPARSVGDRFYTVSNYMHQEKYWVAQIPLNVPVKAQVGFEEFMPGISHVFLIFEFPDTDPIRLRPQVPAKNQRTLRITDLVVSPEGIPPKESKYNLIDAYMQRYPIAIRALSRDQVIAYSVEKLKHEVKVFDLNLTPSQSIELLKTAIASMGIKSFRTKYDLLRNNCATSVLDYIDHVIQPDSAAYPFYYKWLYPIQRAVPIAGPFSTLRILRARQLLSNESGQVLSN